MKIIRIIVLFLMLKSCAPFSDISRFGQGVEITFDPRTIGMQIDDTIMQKNLVARLSLNEKKYFLKIQVEVLDGMEKLSEVNQEEEDLGMEGNKRLGCQCVINNGTVKLTY